MAAVPARALASRRRELLTVTSGRGTAVDDDDDDFDDLPQTHLDDEAYEEFVHRELDGSGRPRGVPPVAVVIVVLIVIVLAIAVVALR